MSGFPIRCRRLIVVSLAVVLCTSLLFPIGLAAGSDPLADAAKTGDTVSQQSADGVTAVERSKPAQIDPTLEDADGIVEVIVRLESDRMTAISTGETKPAALRAAADDSQTSLERAAETTAGLDVERQF